MKFWQRKGILAWLLMPISLLYRCATYFRRKAYHFGLLSTYQAPVPVIVIGNITVGGTGKTPLVIALTSALQKTGLEVGIVSRGYKSHADHYPFVVTDSSMPHSVGDEAVLMKRRTSAPMVIDSDRSRAIQKLLATQHCDVIISDDGLQHYAMERDIEIAVIDGDRQLGNGLCLPSGPLRESSARLKDVDLIVANGSAKDNEILMSLIPGPAYQLSDPSQQQTLESLNGQTINAIAGIGNPDRFFNMLKGLGANIANQKALDDHHHFTGAEFSFNDELPIFITEKDAVKCSEIHDKNIWVIPVEAELPSSFYQSIERRFKQVINDN